MIWNVWSISEINASRQTSKESVLKNTLQPLAPFAGKCVVSKDPFPPLQSLSGWQNLATTPRSHRLFLRGKDQLWIVCSCYYQFSNFCVYHWNAHNSGLVSSKTLPSELRVWDTSVRSHFQLSHDFRKAMFLLGYKGLLRILIKNHKQMSKHTTDLMMGTSYRSSIF